MAIDLEANIREVHEVYVNDKALDWDGTDWLTVEQFRQVCEPSILEYNDFVLEDVVSKLKPYEMQIELCFARAGSPLLYIRSKNDDVLDSALQSLCNSPVNQVNIVDANNCYSKKVKTYVGKVVEAWWD